MTYAADPFDFQTMALGAIGLTVLIFLLVITFSPSETTFDNTPISSLTKPKPITASDIETVRNVSTWRFATTSGEVK